MTITVGYSQDSCTFCCGFHEVGYMETSSKEHFDFEGSNTINLDEAILTILKQAEGRPVMFNFVKKRSRVRNWNESFQDWWTDVPLNRLYVAHELRQLVKSYPGRKHIGTWINPGTGNQIDSYVIFKAAE